MKIEEILSIDDTQNAIIELDTHLNELSNFGSDMERLTKAQRTVLLVENIEREVNNGGFSQFYSNSTGNFAIETFDALNQIGAKKTAEILNLANAQWPGSIVPKDRDDRYEIQEMIEDKATAIWEECDEQFYEYSDDIPNLLIAYVKQNIEQFK